MLRTFRLLSLAAPLLFAGAAFAKPIGFVSGPETGTDIRIAREIAEVGRRAGVPILVRPTMGSIDNLRRMGTRTENAGLGLVQSDVLGFLKKSQSAESQSIASKVRLVAPLYREEVHLLARRDIASLRDLEGKRVVLGTEGSGSMLTATSLFSALGVKPGKLYKVAPPEAATAVLTGQADAAVIVGGAPLKLFQNMNELARDPKSAEAQALAGVHFLPLNAEGLSEGYESATLHAKDYPFLGEDVPTVAVRAMLVAYDFTLKNEPYYHSRCADLGRLGDALRKADPANGAHPKWAEALAALRQPPAAQASWPQDACLSPRLGRAPSAAKAPEPVVPQATAPSPLELKLPAHLSLKEPAVDAPTQRLQNDLIGQLK